MTSKMEQCLKLISEVKKHPELFDNLNPGHSQKELTDRAWSKVGEAVNLKADICEDRWKTLLMLYQTQFLNDSRSRDGSFGEAMQYFLPYLKTGRITGKLPAANVSSPSTSSQDPKSSSSNEQRQKKGKFKKRNSLPHLPIDRERADAIRIFLHALEPQLAMFSYPNIIKFALYCEDIIANSTTEPPNEATVWKFFNCRHESRSENPDQH